MRPPPITLTLPKHHSILIELDNGDQILISNHDSNYAPANEVWDRVRVYVEEAGDARVVFTGEPDLTEEQRVASQKDIHEAEPGDRIKLPPGAPDFDEILLTKLQPIQPMNLTSSLGLGISPLDHILARAVAPGPTAAEEIIRSPTATYPAAPAAPNYPASTVSSVLAASSEAVVTQPPAPPSYNPMDEAPRGGEFVMLSGGDPTEPVAARWSSALGRQFWVDEAGDSLGFDNDFEGWRTPTQSEREEFNL